MIHSLVKVPSLSREIFHKSPSRCAVADGCWISLDRRLTVGENDKTSIAEIQNLPAVKAANAEVTMYQYERPAYTGLRYPTECLLPNLGYS